jgi:hypothetical protein
MGRSRGLVGLHGDGVGRLRVVAGSSRSPLGCDGPQLSGGFVASGQRPGGEIGGERPDQVRLRLAPTHASAAVESGKQP